MKAKKFFDTTINHRHISWQKQNKNNQLTDVSSHLIHLGEIVKIKKFDNFDWKLVLSSISQGQSYNQKVALFRCPSDLTNFVKICAFVQSLEVILERSDSLGWQLPVWSGDCRNFYFGSWSKIFGCFKKCFTWLIYGSFLSPVLLVWLTSRSLNFTRS